MADQSASLYSFTSPCGTCNVHANRNKQAKRIPGSTRWTTYMYTPNLAQFINHPVSSLRSSTLQASLALSGALHGRHACWRLSVERLIWLCFSWLTTSATQFPRDLWQVLRPPITGVLGRSQQIAHEFPGEPRRQR